MTKQVISVYLCVLHLLALLQAALTEICIHQWDYFGLRQLNNQRCLRSPVCCNPTLNCWNTKLNVAALWFTSLRSDFIRWPGCFTMRRVKTRAFILMFYQLVFPKKGSDFLFFVKYLSKCHCNLLVTAEINNQPPPWMCGNKGRLRVNDSQMSG